MHLWHPSYKEHPKSRSHWPMTVLQPVSQLKHSFKEGFVLTTHRKALTTGYWILTGLLFVCGLIMLVVAPAQTAFGPAQRIFYIHLPAAICTFLAALVLFVASVGYLWSRSIKWDDLASSAAKVTVLLCTVVLLTGMIWGKSEWGLWWTWSPRLTFSLVLWILYLAYLIIRPMIQSPTRRATICAVYGLAAFIDVPLVYVSVKLMPDIHPSSVELEPTMQLTLLVWFIAIPLLTAGLIAAGSSLNTQQRTLDTLARESNSNTDLANTHTGEPS